MEAERERAAYGEHTGKDWPRGRKRKHTCWCVHTNPEDSRELKDVRAVALAYLLQRQPFVFPCVGGRKPAQLISNLDALKIVLSEEHVKKIENVVLLDVGYPNSYIVRIVRTVKEHSTDLSLVQGDYGREPDNSLRAVVCYDIEPPAAPILPQKQ